MIDTNDLYIPDVYNLGEYLSEEELFVRDPKDARNKLNAGEAVLSLWHMAHNMKKEIERLQKAHPAEKYQFSEYVPEHEREYLARFFSILLQDGNKITVNDSVEDVVTDSTDINEILSNLGGAEEDVITVTNGTDSLGWFHLIYNNGSEHDPEIVICDYSANRFCDSATTRAAGDVQCDTCLDNTDIDCHDCEQYQDARADQQ